MNTSKKTSSCLEEVGFDEFNRKVSQLAQPTHSLDGRVCALPCQWGDDIYCRVVERE